jgi:thiol-disulfide isomerase/thioredoxin
MTGVFFAVWIGVSLGSGHAGGARVNAVTPGSPGARAGVRAGEEVLAVDDQLTHEPRDVIAIVRKSAVGQVARLRLVDEKGRTRTLKVTYEERPDDRALQRHLLLGNPAPKLPRVSGLSGKVVLIDFFATWCGPCIDGMPHLEALHKKLGPRGLAVVGVSSEAPGVITDAKARFRVSYPLVSDEEMSANYQVFALPTMVVIDRKGIVREVAISDNDAIDEAVEEALRQK